MDILKIKELLTEAETKIASAVELTRQCKLSPESDWDTILLPIYEMRDQARRYLGKPETVLHSGNVVTKWSVPFAEGAVLCATRYHELGPYLCRLLEIYDQSATKNPLEAASAINQFNDRIFELFEAAIMLRRYQEASYASANPPTYTGLLDVKIGVPPWAVQPIEDIKFIKAWVESQKGTGQPPVVALEGIVGEVLGTTPWHETIVDYRYGNPNEPGRRLAEWQTDILMASVQTGAMLTVSPGMPKAHLTKLEGKFWLSVGAKEKPTGPTAIILTDVNSEGQRVVQRVSV